MFGRSRPAHVRDHLKYPTKVDDRKSALGIVIIAIVGLAIVLAVLKLHPSP